MKLGFFILIIITFIVFSLNLIVADDTSLEVVTKPSLRFGGSDLSQPITWVNIAIILIFTIFGIIFLFYSKDIKSKSLKTAIILPLLSWILGIIYWVGHLFYIAGRGVLLDFGAYIFYFLLIFPFIGLISIGFSIWALIKINEKKLATIILIMNIIYTIIPVILLRKYGIH